MSMVESQRAYKETRLFVVMGSSGCGKSTIGNGLALKLGAKFIEGDDHHTSQNKEKMSSGVPLTDEDRWPWLGQLGLVMSSSESVVVASCSALKKVYRDHITKYCKEPVLFIYLHGSRVLLASRLSNRTDHFMNDDLLESQLATLEVPGPDEFSIRIDIDQPVDTMINEILLTVRP